MATDKFTIIGVDGGASKVSAWTVNYSAAENLYSLSAYHTELPYASIEGYLNDFKPVPVADQINEREQSRIVLTDEEIMQGNAYIEATKMVIQSLAAMIGVNSVLVGIGMPGLKTADQRGINVIANGPRIIDYCTILEEKLHANRVNLIAPFYRIGSDADYCGMGEYYAKEGSFRSVNNAYYLGGGTGAADALILKGKLIPFDSTRQWMAKTWEMKNDLNLSFERYASASGLQFIYSTHAHKSLDTLNLEQIFPQQIAEKASAGEKAAIRTFEDATKYLALLIYERICTLFCGSDNAVKFVSANREPLNNLHNYRGEIFDRIVIGQRLGDLMNSAVGRKIVTIPFLANLSKLIEGSDELTDMAKKSYLHQGKFREEQLIFSKLREAPALGAGIDAHRRFTTKQ